MPDIFIPTTSKKDTSVPVKTSKPEAKPSNPVGLFASYCPSPAGVSFANQEPDETMLLFLRRHFITNVGWIIYIFLLLFSPPILFFVSDFFSISFFTIPQELSLILVATYYVFVFNYAFLRFINWFYHVGIVTQKRLIDLDIDNILHFHLAETGIADVVDVSYSQKGFFQSFFHYGDVPVQTEAIKANFEFEKTPNPSAVADLVTDLRPKHKGGATHA